MKQIEVSKATMGRIPMYLNFLKNAKHNTENISATAIAKQLGLGDVQVRKDLASVSGAGRPKTGYNVEDLIKSLEKFLGLDEVSNVVIIGAGKLGRAFLDYTGFKEYGLDIVAAFDIALTCAERTEFGKMIYPMSDFQKFCEDNDVKIGIITVPADNAQQVCDLLAKNGIKAIWNFAPCTLSVPDGVSVQYENMALSLAYLNKKIP